jgi:hypothetical protein
MVAGFSALYAIKKVALVDIVTFENVLSGLLFFKVVLVDINSVGRGIFQRDLQTVESGVVVRRGFIVAFSEVFFLDSAN